MNDMLTEIGKKITLDATSGTVRITPPTATGSFKTFNVKLLKDKVVQVDLSGHFKQLEKAEATIEIWKKDWAKAEDDWVTEKTRADRLTKALEVIIHTGDKVSMIKTATKALAHEAAILIETRE